jgi:hypothetical protein
MDGERPRGFTYRIPRRVRCGMGTGDHLRIAKFNGKHGVGYLKDARMRTLWQICFTIDAFPPVPASFECPR